MKIKIPKTNEIINVAKDKAKYIGISFGKLRLIWILKTERSGQQNLLTEQGKQIFCYNWKTVNGSIDVIFAENFRKSLSGFAEIKKNHSNK